jgi:hypothetical protein
VVHPDDRARTGDAGQRFTAGQILVCTSDMSFWYVKAAEQAIEPARYANLSSQLEQLQIDHVRGNKKMSDVQAFIANWKSSGGDKLRDWYKELLDKSGSGN